MTDLFGDVATVRSYDSQANIQLDITSERIHGGLGDYLTWKQFLDSPEGQDVAFFGPQLDGGPWGPGAGIGLRKEDTDLIAAFDKALQESIADGSLAKLSVKWFGVDIAPRLRN